MKMRGGLKVLTIRGIELRVHLSLLFLLAYVVMVASVQFPAIAQRAAVDPTELAGGPIAWALLFALGLFVSVALHEFGHAFTAQAQGVRVQGITLMMLGGVSEMERIPERRLAEFKLAIVGPLVSFALAAGLSYGGRLFESPEFYFFCFWLARANLVLAIFNLLPAFPLDGGRALRSLLAAWLGMLRATSVAVRISKGFAWALGILGALSFNLLLVLIAFFIYSAANTELFLSMSRSWLQGLTASEVGLRVEPISGSVLVNEAVRRMLESRATLLPVITGESEPPALISLEQIRKLRRGLWSELPVRELAIAAPRTVSLETALPELLPELASAPLGALPLVDEHGRPIGVLRYSDVTDVIALRSVATDERDHRSAA